MRNLNPYLAAAAALLLLVVALAPAADACFR